VKIAITTEDGKVISAHFGRSPYFAIYEIEDGKIVNKEMRKNTFTGHFRREHQKRPEQHHGQPHHRGTGDPHAHHSVAEGLKDCQVVISHGMGRKAWEDLRARGIEMIVTDETDVEKAVEMYLAGELEDRVEKLH
jgi:predicted Fe-Mo cluster-binding NifX family protein